MLDIVVLYAQNVASRLYLANHISKCSSMGSSESKFGINTTSVVLKMGQISRGKPSEITHFQYNKSGVYSKFHCHI